MKFFGKYKLLLKTKKALEYFIDEGGDLQKRTDILKYYGPKTGKVVKKITRKDLADRVFSEFVRLFYCDSHGFCTCVTCGAKLPRTEIQNGHFVSRGNLKYRFNIQNCHPQDYKCNCILNGNYQRYTLYMIDTFGKQTVESMLNDNEEVKYNQGRYETQIMYRYEFITEKKDKIKKV